MTGCRQKELTMTQTTWLTAAEARRAFGRWLTDDILRRFRRSNHPGLNRRVRWKSELRDGAWSYCYSVDDLQTVASLRGNRRTVTVDGREFVDARTAAKLTGHSVASFHLWRTFCPAVQRPLHCLSFTGADCGAKFSRRTFFARDELPLIVDSQDTVPAGWLTVSEFAGHVGRTKEAVHLWRKDHAGRCPGTRVQLQFSQFRRNGNLTWCLPASQVSEVLAGRAQSQVCPVRPETLTLQQCAATSGISVHVWRNWVLKRCLLLSGNRLPSLPRVSQYEQIRIRRADVDFIIAAVNSLRSDTEWLSSAEVRRMFGISAQRIVNLLDRDGFAELGVRVRTGVVADDNARLSIGWQFNGSDLRELTADDRQRLQGKLPMPAADIGDAKSLAATAEELGVDSFKLSVFFTEGHGHRQGITPKRATFINSRGHRSHGWLLTASQREQLQELFTHRQPP